MKSIDLLVKLFGKLILKTVEIFHKLLYPDSPTPIFNPWHLLVIFISIYILVFTLVGSDKDEKEPPVASSSFPLIGHVLGMFKYEGGYYKRLCEKFPHWPIFSLNVFGSTIYVVNAPELAQAILNNTSSLSFVPFAVSFTKRVLRGRQHVMDTIGLDGGNNPHITAIHHETYSAFALGPAVLETNKRVLNGMARYLNAIGTSGSTLHLFDWIRNAYTVVSAEMLYGTRNPISENPNLVKSIWDFEDGVLRLHLNIFPRWTAPKAYKARNEFQSAFIDYYNQGLDENANAFIKGRAKIGRRDNFTNEDLGSFEVSVFYTSIVNTVPNAFSMLCRILNNPVLTAEIAAEVTSIAERTRDEAGVDKVTLDITAIKSKCPILVSTFQENLRICVNATSIRVVMKDVTIKDEYLLKKGGIVQICGGALHESPKYWGDDVDTFNPYRFIDTVYLTREQKKLQDKGLLPFGGGKHLCPGRHLAFVEVTSFIAMLVYAFDVRMKDSKLVQPPPFKKQYLGEASKKPAHDVEVLIKRKKDFDGVVFDFKVDNEVDATKNVSAV